MGGKMVIRYEENVTREEPKEDKRVEPLS